MNSVTVFGDSTRVPRTTRDTLLGRRVTIDQLVGGYRAAIDPVLLAAAVPAQAGDRVLDLGAGVGAATLCLAARVPGCRIDGLELQPLIAARARANNALNGVSARVTVHTGSVARPPETLGEAYDHVMLNPPFMPLERADPRVVDDPSRVETEPLEVWLECAIARVRAKGSITVVHRSDRLDSVIAGLAAAAGGIEVIPIWSRAGTDAKRVIVRARRGVSSPARVSPGLVMHTADGCYTSAAAAVLRDMASLTV